MDNASRLTTIDNPYDPFEQFSQWFMFDVDNGYNTCSYLARIAKTSDEYSEQENAAAIDNAIDQIMKYDFTNMYRKVSRKEKNI